MIDPVELWCTALESGEYEQTSFTLKNGNAYCCLGVLCEVAKAEGVIQTYNPYEAILPVKVREWAGLATRSGSYIGDNNLTRDNDSKGLTFPEIAAIIRSRPRGLFYES